MCGRYASSRRPEDLIEEFEVVDSRVPEPLAPDYNVAPTKEVYAVVERPPSKDSEEPPARQLRVVKWGLVPSWAKDPSIGNRMINARMETVAEKPAYKRALAVRRCLLPADGGVLAMAGLYEIWRDPSREEDDPDRFRWTCTVLTTQAEDDLGHIHDRMPLMVERDRWSDWLDPTAPQDHLLDLLVPAAPGKLEAYPVSTLVSNVKNNGPELLEPLPLEEVIE